MAEYLYRLRNIQTGQYYHKVWKRESDLKRAVSLSYGALAWAVGAGTYGNADRWNEWEVVLIEQKPVKTMPVIAYKADKKVKIEDV